MDMTTQIKQVEQIPVYLSRKAQDFHNGFECGVLDAVQALETAREDAWAALRAKKNAQNENAYRTICACLSLVKAKLNR